MSDMEALQGEVHALGKEIAGLRPLVHEVHNTMPRISSALEMLARISEKQENNIEDHKRLHYRITDTEHKLKDLAHLHDGLDLRFEALREEHVICKTTSQVEQRVVSTSWWTKAKAKAGEKVVELITMAMVLFIGWIVLSHLPEYPKTAPLFNQQPVQKGGR